MENVKQIQKKEVHNENKPPGNLSLGFDNDRLMNWLAFSTAKVKLFFKWKFHEWKTRITCHGNKDNDY